MSVQLDFLTDLIILGATPAGITAAIAAARADKNVTILERTLYIGGLPANGLGATDIATRGATGGLFLEFVFRIKGYYTRKYGLESPQALHCDQGYHFEPSVAELVFHEWLKEYPRIRILTERQFDPDSHNVIKADGNIEAILVNNRTTGLQETFRGRFFLDATYEGDLIAAAGVPFFLGRESYEAYGEIGAGRTYKLWYGPECEGSTHSEDNGIQAYNYRLCLTDDPCNRIVIKKPQNYNRSEYKRLIYDVTTGLHAGVDVKEISQEAALENIERSKENMPPIPNKLNGIVRLLSNVVLPNRKVDGNNQHFAFISTDLPEENWPYPTSDWVWRDRFAQRLREYTEGLLYFAQNDPELPQWFRCECSRWGWAKDEYDDNGHFPRQMYVREARRMKGKYVFTANDVSTGSKNLTNGMTNSDQAGVNGIEAKYSQSPVWNGCFDTVTASHYALDSHGVRKYEPGRVHLDGMVSYPCQPYSVPYRVMVPDAPIWNLLAPVPVSASHIGFSTLRMEPCWMALGQAAGVAASLCIDSGCSADKVDVQALQRTLLDQGAILIYDPRLWKDGVSSDRRADMQWQWLKAAENAR